MFCTFFFLVRNVPPCQHVVIIIMHVSLPLTQGVPLHLPQGKRGPRSLPPMACARVIPGQGHAEPQPGVSIESLCCNPLLIPRAVFCSAFPSHFLLVVVAGSNFVGANSSPASQGQVDSFLYYSSCLLRGQRFYRAIPIMSLHAGVFLGSPVAPGWARFYE